MLTWLERVKGVIRSKSISSMDQLLIFQLNMPFTIHFLFMRVV